MLNFTIEIALRNDVRWGTLYDNGTGFGAMADVISNDADLTLGKYAETHIRDKFMTPTVSYFSSPLIVVVPIGEKYTSLEKLLKPFELETWEVVIVFNVVVFTFIALVKARTSLSIRQFIFGKNANSEHFNTFVAFLGQNVPEQRVPGRNFARTLFCIFMLYTLVIRGSYSGALFKFLKSDNIRKSHAKTVNEMVEKNFKFYMQIPAEYLVKNMTKIYNNRIVIKPNETAIIQEKTLSSSFEGGLLSSYEQIQYFNRMNRQNYTLKVCPEILYRFQYVMYFRKNSAFVRHFNKYLESCRANGLMSYLVEKYLPRQNDEISIKAPKPLVLEQVSGCFLLLIFGSLVSCFIFYVEMCI